MKRMVAAFTVAGLLVAGVAVSADDKPESVVLYRQTEMAAMGKHLKAANLLGKGEIASRPGDLQLHADALHALSTDMCALFPAGTGPDKVKTDAKAEVWSKPADFTAACTAFATETQALVDAAKAGDVAKYATQVGKVGDACGSCHDGFRVED